MNAYARRPPLFSREACAADDTVLDAPSRQAAPLVAAGFVVEDSGAQLLWAVGQSQARWRAACGLGEAPVLCLPCTRGLLVDPFGATQYHERAGVLCLAAEAQDYDRAHRAA